MDLKCVSQSAQASITNYHSLGGLNNRHSFLIVMETEKSKTMVPADLVLGESPLPGLQIATFSLCPYVTKRVSSGVTSLYKGMNTIMEAPPS